MMVCPSPILLDGCWWRWQTYYFYGNIVLCYFFERNREWPPPSYIFRGSITTVLFYCHSSSRDNECWSLVDAPWKWISSTINTCYKMAICWKRHLFSAPGHSPSHTYGKDTRLLSFHIHSSHSCKWIWFLRPFHTLTSITPLYLCSANILSI